MVRKFFLRMLVDHYCQGRGLEIGPGSTPYGDPEHTEFLDRYDEHERDFSIDINADATSIPRPDGAYDYVISSHCLEHIPDTLKGLMEWTRVLKPGGILFLMLPHAHRTIDRGRVVHPLQHHLDDYAKAVDLSDDTHHDEFLNITMANVIEMRMGSSDEQAGIFEYSEKLAKGQVHFHCWTQHEMVDILRHLGLEILFVMAELPDHVDSFLVVSRKS